MIPAIRPRTFMTRSTVNDEKHSNETHASTTDLEAKLAKKGRGKEAKLSYRSVQMVAKSHAARDHWLAEWLFGR
jgi:hypothetical protein